MLRLLFRSLIHYWRWHSGLFLGVALATAIICGSLVTGDSVRATLAHQSAIRLGKVATVAVTKDGFFTEALAEKCVPACEPVLLLPATVTEPEKNERTGGVNLYGVTDGFWKLGKGIFPSMGDGAIINRGLARALGIIGNGIGQEIIVRFEKPSLLSREAPLSGESDLTVAQRLPVSAIVDDAMMGAFSLQAGQAAPLNIYLPRARLQDLAQLPGRANLLLSESDDSIALEESIQKNLTAADAGLSVKVLSGSQTRVVSTGRIFLSPESAARVAQSYPGGRGVLTYLVNEIRNEKGRITPYSMASAVASELIPLATGTCRIHQWLADDLGVMIGDALTIKYYLVTRARQLEETEARFTVAGIVPMTDASVRREWAPDFPGVSESENCRDWKPGIPIRQDLIRDKDDAYWREYKATPKIWLPLADGQRLWQNRFGEMTSLWVETADSADVMADKIARSLDPSEAGIIVVPVRESAARAVSQGMDFGALFLSMSAFLILTALLLALLLFVFGIEQRASQLGVLRAVGWSARSVRWLFVMEAFLICLPAIVVGALLGLVYTEWTLDRLESEWADAALGLRFLYTVKPSSLIAGALGTIVLAMGAVWWVTRRIQKMQPRNLLVGSVRQETLYPRKKKRFRIPIGLGALVAGGMLWAAPRTAQHLAPMLFFGAAFLLLVEGLRVLNHFLLRLAAVPSPDGPRSIAALGMKNAVRRRGRSMALAGLMAMGVFMVTALNAFRTDARQAENSPLSGAGGFSFLGQSSLPIYEDLNSQEGRKAWDISPDEWKDVKVVPFRARDGEEASCLNLNRAQTPRVLGVNPAALLGHFSFAAQNGVAKKWEMLHDPSEQAIPAIMDQYSAMFALGKNVGEFVIVPDAKGVATKLKLVGLLAGTVLQGNIIIAEDHFKKLYPDSGGSRFFLVACPSAKAAAVRTMLTTQLTSRGLFLSSAPERLAQFQAVQNTYLTIFSTLGGLALVLATLGLGILVARHVTERRSEFAVLAAGGFQLRDLRRMILAEHWFLFLFAVVLGALTALIAVAPSLHLAGSGGLPVSLLAILLISVILGGFFFCALAARFTLRGTLAASLRSE